METTKTKTIDVRCPGEYLANDFNRASGDYKRVQTKCNKFLVRVYYSVVNNSDNKVKIGLDIKCPRCKEKFERIEII